MNEVTPENPVQEPMAPEPEEPQEGETYEGGPIPEVEPTENDENNE